MLRPLCGSKILRHKTQYGRHTLRALPDDYSLEFFNSKSLTKRSKERGYNYFMNAYIFQVKLERVDSRVDKGFISRCEVIVLYHSMRKSETPHKLNMVVSATDRKITDSSCLCVAGYVSYFIFHVLFISFIAHCFSHEIFKLMLFITSLSVVCREHALHILGLVYTLIHYQQQGLKRPALLSCASLPQQWHKPHGSKMKPKLVVNMILAKGRHKKKA